MSKSGAGGISSGWNEESGKPSDEETGHGAYSRVEKSIQFGHVLHEEQNDDTRKHTTERGGRSRFPGEDPKNEQSTKTAGEQSHDLEPLVEDAFSWIDRKQQGRTCSDRSKDDRRSACEKEFLRG